MTRRHHRARRRCLRFGSSPSIPQSPIKPTTITHFPPPSHTTLYTKFQKPVLHGLAYLRPHFLRFRDTPEKTPKASFVPYVHSPILVCVFHYGEVMPEPSSAARISLVSYLFLSIYIYVYVLSYILRFIANVPFIVSYFFIWCFGYAHSRIPYMGWVGFRTAFTDGTMDCEV